MSSDPHSHTRISSICYHRFDIGSIKQDLFVKHGIIAALQRLPIGNRLVPIFAARSIFTSFEISKCCFVRSDHTTTGPHFDRQIAQSQTTFHRQTANRRSSIFNEITGRTAGRHFRHEIEGDILRRYPFSKIAFHTDTHGFRLCLQDTLGSHHHFHFTGSDTESDSTDCPMGRGMRVATDNCHPRQGQSAFRTYHMNNTIPFIHHSIMSQTEFGSVFCQRIDLVLRNRIFDRFILIMCRRVMVRHTIDTFRTERFQTTCTHTGKGLRTGYFMTVQPVYIKLCGSLFDHRHHVGIPNLVK